MKIISKLLSPNDVGETGSHQVGILVPKYGGFLDFFPRLNTNALNPDASVDFLDPNGKHWGFRFIYYNNGKFGGTRNEYRLTRMTGFFRTFGARSGDGIVLSLDEKGLYHAAIMPQPDVARVPSPETIDDKNIEQFKAYNLTFDSNWKIVNWEERP